MTKYTLRYNRYIIYIKSLMQHLRKYCFFLEVNEMNDNEGFKLLSNLEKQLIISIKNY